jgi:endoglycosylceramidase
MATEYGATTDPATITRIASTIETGLVPWAFWSYDENLVIDKTKPPTPDNVHQPVLDALTRPYAVATDGFPTAWRYDAASGALQFRYKIPNRNVDEKHAEHKGDTEILLSSRAYPTGYRISVTGGHVVSAPCALRVRIRNDRHAPRVAVHVERARNCDS